TAFSSGGPTPSGNVKPDLMAVGESVVTGYTTKGGFLPYILAAGTSISAPLVTGALALVEWARPGLRVEQYRSLILNSAVQIKDSTGAPYSPQIIGTGKLDVLGAVQNTLTAVPSVLNFGPGTGS